MDRAYVEARQAAEEAAFAAQPHSALGAQRRQSLLQATPEKSDPVAELQRHVGRKCTNTVDGAPCDKCAGFGFEIQPRYTPLSPQSTKCGLCSCDVSCHDGPVETRAKAWEELCLPSVLRFLCGNHQFIGAVLPQN